MKQLELTPRLRTVANLVPDGANLADIGTDHAYLPVHLLLEGKICHAIAADLRPGPLDRAKLTAKEHDCNENIEFRLCDGLSAIVPDEVNTIVIAGMGGETIATILQAAPWTKAKEYTIILQPMSAQNDLRAWLWRNGYRIDSEQITCEGDKLYNIFLVRYGDADSMSLGEEWAGRQWQGMDQDLRSQYLTRLLDKISRAIYGISRGTGEKDRTRLDELQQIYAALQKMKEDWDTWHK